MEVMITVPGKRKGNILFLRHLSLSGFCEHKASPPKCFSGEGGHILPQVLLLQSNRMEYRVVKEGLSNLQVTGVQIPAPPVSNHNY